MTIPRMELADAAHVGSEQTLATVRRRFWMLHGKSAVRRVVRRCVTMVKCTRFKGRISERQMGMLAGGQLAAAPPFTRVGADYFRPFDAKIGRGLCKRWVCIFTHAPRRRRASMDLQQ